MARRFFIPELRAGRLALPEEAAHHLVRVLRLADGAEVEAFDAAGRRGTGRLVLEAGANPTVEIAEVAEAAPFPSLTVATAIPKGDRADYLVEKLAEVGVARWVPLEAERSVVVPKGTSKTTRWERIAVEAARQSHAPAVMAIAEVAKPADVVVAGAWIASTGPGASDASDAPAPAVVMVGPEGGWTAAEERALMEAGAVRVTLGPTVLRVETAAIVAAAMALARWRA